MAENSKIEWTHHTVNFWGPDAPRRLRVQAAAREALRYERQSVAQGRRFRVFTNSMVDFFEDRRDLDQPRVEALDVMRRTPHLDWLILTKRPESILALLTKAARGDFGFANEHQDELRPWLEKWLDGDAPSNVWLGTTVEDQERADQRVPALLKVPARIRFLSCDPLLGLVDLDQPRCDTHDREELSEDGSFCNECVANGWSGELSFGHWLDPLNDGIAWVICGGESGREARPMHPDWVRGLRDQCAAAGVPFLFKQWGEWQAMEPAEDEPYCCVCGCTENCACEGGCSWVDLPEDVDRDRCDRCIGLEPPPDRPLQFFASSLNCVGNRCCC